MKPVAITMIHADHLVAHAVNHIIATIIGGNVKEITTWVFKNPIKNFMYCEMNSKIIMF